MLTKPIRRVIQPFESKNVKEALVMSLGKYQQSLKKQYQQKCKCSIKKALNLKNNVVTEGRLYGMKIYFIIYHYDVIEMLENS